MHCAKKTDQRDLADEAGGVWLGGGPSLGQARTLSTLGTPNQIKWAWTAAESGTLISQ